MRMVKMTPDQADTFCQMQEPSGSHAQHVAHLSSDVVVAMELIGDDAIKAWQSIIGPPSPAEAKSTAPNSIRAHIGTDDVCNAVHGSSNASTASSEINFFFIDSTQKWPT